MRLSAGSNQVAGKAQKLTHWLVIELCRDGNNLDRLPISIPEDRGLTTLKRAHRRRDGEASGIGLPLLMKRVGLAGSTQKSEQFANQDQH
jgi:hypothetical protein